jgi:hypothetical protein
MASNDYQFYTHWRVRGRVEDVFGLVLDISSLPRWWPAAYLGVIEREPGDPATGIGKVADIHSRGWLPYELHWRARIVDASLPHGFTLAASGDFDGRGIWRFEQDGEWVTARFDWKLRVEKPGVRELSFLLKPVFEANHRWAMARGEESLALELARRAAGEDARAQIPPPPGPATHAGFVLAAASLAIVAGAALVWSARRKWGRWDG